MLESVLKGLEGMNTLHQHAAINMPIRGSGYHNRHVQHTALKCQNKVTWLVAYILKPLLL